MTVLRVCRRATQRAFDPWIVPSEYWNGIKWQLNKSKQFKIFQLDNILTWANPGLLFVSFPTNFYRKNCRLQQDLNSDRRSRRWACWPLYRHPRPVDELFLLMPYKRPRSLRIIHKFKTYKVNVEVYLLIIMLCMEIFAWAADKSTTVSHHR